MRFKDFIEINQFNRMHHQPIFLFDCYILHDFKFSIPDIAVKYKIIPQYRRLVFDFAIFKFPFQIVIRLNKTGEMCG